MKLKFDSSIEFGLLKLDLRTFPVQSAKLMEYPFH